MECNYLHPSLTPLGDNLETEDTVLGEVHVPLCTKGLVVCERKKIAYRRTKQASVTRTTVHSLALEVRREGTFAVGAVLERLVAVRAESTGEHTDVAKDTLERLVQDVRHLVLLSYSICSATVRGSQGTM